MAPKAWNGETLPLLSYCLFQRGEQGLISGSGNQFDAITIRIAAEDSIAA